MIQAGTTEVAVKVIRREFFKLDPKVRENVDREIKLLKLLRGCEYVVQLYHVQVSKICDNDANEKYREAVITGSAVHNSSELFL